MTIIIGNTEIERVEVIDDDPGARKAYGYQVEDMNLVPVLADNPRYTDLAQFVSNVRTDADAAICDYYLSAKNYANFNGAQTVSALYKHQFPAILCTRFYDREIDDIRRFRHQIPVLLTPTQVEPSMIELGFRKCFDEFEGRFLPSRLAWRTLVRVEQFNESDYFHIIVPGWNPSQEVRLKKDIIPQQLRDRIMAGQARFHAEVNLGAEKLEDLYFKGWELE